VHSESGFAGASRAIQMDGIADIQVGETTPADTFYEWSNNKIFSRLQTKYS